MYLTDLIKEGAARLSGAYPEREAREMVFAFLEHHLGTKRHTHIVEPDYEVTEESASVALDAFERMAAGEPLQYVAGFADFYGRRFRVTPDVLIPRPETELLCREAVVKMSSAGKGGDPESVRILDLCTGSGCIAWTLALEMPGAVVTAVDISDGALSVASSQDFSEEMAVTGALVPQFLKADVLAGPSVILNNPSVILNGSEGSPKYDILVSNPPYVMNKEKALMRPNVLEHEPHLALFVSDDDPLIFYRAVAAWALAVLKPDGYGIVEINESLGRETAGLFLGAGLRDVRIIPDLSDRDRFVSFRR